MPHRGVVIYNLKVIRYYIFVRYVSMLRVQGPLTESPRATQASCQRTRLSWVPEKAQRILKVLMVAMIQWCLLCFEGWLHARSHHSSITQDTESSSPPQVQNTNSQYLQQYPIQSYEGRMDQPSSSSLKCSCERKKGKPDKGRNKKRHGRKESLRLIC